jgi:hypothetical protein
VSVSFRPAEAIKVSIGTNGPAVGVSRPATTVQREHDPQAPVLRPESRSHVRLAR